MRGISVIKRIAIILFVLLLPQAVCAEQLDPYQKKVDLLVAPYIDGQYIIGVSIGLVMPEGSYVYHYGTTKADHDAKPTNQTLYEIGSITKTFTGLLLAQGVVNNRWELDDAASKYLAQAASLPSGVTLKRLAIHTSGLPRMPNDFSPADHRNPYADYGEKSLVKTLEGVELAYQPGKSALYSNLGMGLLGNIMAKREGKSYEALLESWVLTPLSMPDTAIRLDEKQVKHIAQPHNADGEPVSVWEFDALAGAGGIRSNITDMLTYAQTQINPGAGPLGPAIRLTQQRHSPVDGPKLGQGMGLGWFLFDRDMGLSHDGQTGGFASSVTISLQSKVAVIVLANTANAYPKRLSGQLWQLIQGKEPKPAKLNLPVAVSSERLQTYTGQYKLQGVGEFKITKENDRLYAKLASQPRLRLFASDQDSFKYRAVEASIDFLSDKDGRVNHLILHQNGLSLKFPKIDLDND